MGKFIAWLEKDSVFTMDPFEEEQMLRHENENQRMVTEEGEEFPDRAGPFGEGNSTK